MRTGASPRSTAPGGVRRVTRSRTATSGGADHCATLPTDRLRRAIRCARGRRRAVVPGERAGTSGWPGRRPARRRPRGPGTPPARGSASSHGRRRRAARPGPSRTSRGPAAPRCRGGARAPPSRAAASSRGSGRARCRRGPRGRRCSRSSARQLPRGRAYGREAVHPAVPQRNVAEPRPCPQVSAPSSAAPSIGGRQQPVGDVSRRSGGRELRARSGARTTLLTPSAPISTSPVSLPPDA